MTVSTLELSPQVELTHGLTLTPLEIAALTASNASVDPEVSWREALLAYRSYAMRELRRELLGQSTVNEVVIRGVLAAVWSRFSPTFGRSVGPMVAEAYIRAFRNVENGNIPIQMIYALADDHADRVGAYFNDTSADALVQGFNTYLNRQVPQKVAINRAIEAFGMTPRQMSGYTSATQLQPSKIESATPRGLKEKVTAYITKTIAARLNVFKRQEAHNLDEQAKQVAWMWMVENHKLPETAEKIWLTAADERVCTQCGPMNKKRVRVNDKFELPNGNVLYTPGAHVNCRCEVRLEVNPLRGISKARDPDYHNVRGGDPENPGRFSRRPGPRFKEAEASPFLDEAVRQAEQVRQAKPVIEPEQKLDIDVPTPRRKLDIPLPQRQLDITPPAPKAEPAPPKMDIDLPTPKAAPKLDIDVPVAGKLDIEPPRFDIKPDWQRLVELQDERQTSQQVWETEETRYIPARQITQPHTDDAVPAVGYFVGNTGYHMRDSQTTAQLTDDDPIELVSEADRYAWIAEQIKSQYEHNVSREYNSWMGGQDELEITMPNSSNPDDFRTAYIPGELVAEALEKALIETDVRSELEELDHQEAAEITWHENQDGDSWDEIVSWRELIDYIGIDPDSYRPVLFRVTHGYDNAYREDDEIWKTPGVYTVVNPAWKVVSVEGHNIPYLQVDLRPNVQSETRYQRRDRTE